MNVKIDEYYIDLPEEWSNSTDDFSVLFLNDASKLLPTIHKQHYKDYNFLDMNFIMLVKKIIQDPDKLPDHSTSMLIYSLADCKNPVVKIADKAFDSVRTGFFTMH